MKVLGLNEIREAYLRFFESKEHLRMPSFPLVPLNDSSLLLVNSGMAPLKPYFTGKETPPRKRVTTCQKCIRTPDIERVGKTARHGTFFEMLGNFSFGDYFKSEACAWAWEFITKTMDIPADRLFVSIYLDDDQAFDIWTREVGVPADRIVRLGKADNFWEIGTGPCGPCSEIYYDRGEAAGCGSPDCAVGCDCDRYVEFWNLVFTQFDSDGNGNYTPLAKPNIDTGMGLERIAAIMQGADNLFEVDTIKNVMARICGIAGINYKENEAADVSLRVITDHIRGTVFMICDGVLPSNEGRGYVLRRILRRAARHGKLLGIKEPFLFEVADTVIEESASGYPELLQRQEYIKKVVKTEERRFDETIDQGLNILNDYINELKAGGSTVLSGERAFKLYDTYGFPIDLTKEILIENGFTLDEDEYNNQMSAQRERARSARADSGAVGWREDELLTLIKNTETEFIGYDNLNCSAKVMLLIEDNADVPKVQTEDSQFIMLLDKTVIYAESGGAAGDCGTISFDGGEAVITDCKKMGDGKFVHYCTLKFGALSVGDTVEVAVDQARRRAVSRNHSTTHLLQAALRNVLGTHINQAGSLVNDEKLRFDFSHYAPLSAEEIVQVEREVNEKILDALEINAAEMPIEQAKKTGATALFGEKYGDVVRVVKMEDYSVELCGGCHLKNTSQAGLFKITSEAGIAAGVRRIEGITGIAVYDMLNSLVDFSQGVSLRVKASLPDSLKKIDELNAQMKEYERENGALKSKLAQGGVSDVIERAENIGGILLVRHNMGSQSNDQMRGFADMIKDKVSGALVIALASLNGDKVSFVVSVNAEAMARGAHAGNIVKEIAKIADGTGGGKPDFAQAGGRDISKADQALAYAETVIKNIIGG